MPGRSSSRSSSRSYSYSSPKSPASVSKPVATPVATPIPVQHNMQIQQPGFFSNVWQGFGLGAGQSIAMNMFRSDPKVTHVHENAPISTTDSSSSLYSKEYTQCLKDKYDDKEVCKQYVQCLKDNSNDKDLCKQFM